MRKPRALRSGDRIAIVAPASPFAREAFEAGIDELARIGFEPVYDPTVFDRLGYLAGTAETRSRALLSAWADPSVAAIIAARGGYGSVHLLPLLDPALFHRQGKAFIGYSDNTTLLTWINQTCQLVAFHGPMIAGRFARGTGAYDLDSFRRCLCEPVPAGPIDHPQVSVLREGTASGVLTGGTLTQLVASLGTPYAFDPPPGCVLFLDEVGERPYRLDRMLTQLRQSGLLGRAVALVFGELPRCDEPKGDAAAARAVVETLIEDFAGPVLYGLPSGHTTQAALTLPFGVRARVRTGSAPALVIEEAAVE